MIADNLTQSVLIFSILNHPCSFMVYYYLFGGNVHSIDFLQTSTAATDNQLETFRNEKRNGASPEYHKTSSNNRL